MGVLQFLALAAAAFLLASRFYGAYLTRVLGIDPGRATPACRLDDGRDYVPSKRYVVFAHHFSAIAGAGPILGPTIAILYGYVPAWLWIVLGGIFIGAVHDYVTLFVSMREDGRSIADVAKKTLGLPGFALYISFTIIMLVLVNAAFLSSVATSLTSEWPLGKLGLESGQTILKTFTHDGVEYGRIGGIASTSVVIITFSAPILGFFMFRRGLGGVPAYAAAALICAASIVAGIYAPIILPLQSWMAIITVYVLVAASLPVWLILQPRDFINVQILYGGVGLLLTALLVAGVGGASFNMPAFNVAEGVKSLGLLWPMMFITIACGAISGFHSLVASGTSSKQISNERHARRIGYDAMLLESLLAVCVLLAIGIGLSFFDYKSLVFPTEAGVKSNPILAFSLGAGHLFNNAFGLPLDLATVFGILLVEGFVITTLDVSVRLNRYLFEELWAIVFEKPPALLKSQFFNAGLAVALMAVFAYSNAFNKLWPLFGTGNQLLAALSLITVMVWLHLKNVPYKFALLPTVFMICTAMASLLILLEKYYNAGNYTLVATALVLLALSAGVVLLVVQRIIAPALRAVRPPA